jgi:SAM-dependent methyltransferase
MDQDRHRWNDKYQADNHPTNPSRIVEAHFTLARRGKALDIAAGTGRNALFLADHGFKVDAVDISDVGFAKFPRRHPRVNRVCTDLDTFEITENHYDLIINIRFLNRRMMPYIQAGLVSGGLLIFETYVEDKGHSANQPSCRDYLLRKNELLHTFMPLHIVYYREMLCKNEKDDGQIASLVAVKSP